MKFLAFTCLSLMSLSAFAQTCYVDMIHTPTRSVVRSFTGYGDSHCLEGMKECRKSIRLDYSSNPSYPNGSLDCVAAGYAPVPTPTPIPTPTPNPYPTPTDYFQVGTRVLYTQDNTLGTVISVDRYYNTLCVKFDRPRYDGALERCNIDAVLLRVSSTPNPIDLLQVGSRVVYTQDNTLGYVTRIDYNSNSVCVRFDRARSDGAYERCGVSATFVSPNYTDDPIRNVLVNDRVFYTPDNSLGFITSIDFNTYTVCVKFDRRRPDGAMERCGISAALVRRAY